MTAFAHVRFAARMALDEIAAAFGVPLEDVRAWDAGHQRAPDYVVRTLDLLGSFQTSADTSSCGPFGLRHTRYPQKSEPPRQHSVDRCRGNGQDLLPMKVEFTGEEARARAGSTVAGKAVPSPRRSGKKPRLLDLFCCAGGAAVGYHHAGFEVVGVDIVPRPNFPFEFIQADAMSLDPTYVATFDAIHASPPCQSYSDLAKRNGNGHEWPRLIEPVRDMLLASGKPYVIENVEGAPLLDPVVLCGTMFPELRVLRHRLFESNFPIIPPPHKKHPKVHTFDRRKSHFGKTNEWVDFVQVTGGGNCSVAAARDAMGIDWMTKGEINEAIPPAYTRLIGQQLITYIQEIEAEAQDALEAA